MSPLLIVAIVALVIVVGLLWLQRRSHEPTSRVPPTPITNRPPPSPGVRESPTETQRIDPVLGAITYVGHGFWTRDEALAFGAGSVLVEIVAGPEGPGPDIQNYMRIALSPGTSLDTRARAAIHDDTRVRGAAIVGLEPSELSIGPDGDGVFRGYVFYDETDGPGHFSVESTDAWRTLTAKVL